MQFANIHDQSVTNLSVSSAQNVLCRLIAKLCMPLFEIAVDPKPLCYTAMPYLNAILKCHT